ncbi:hypothetical protein CYY_008069 [Polysphondylium violaceum]|uniref:CCAAT-binding factor domain-containing protein n=1 Tax=Polysphondylium violaceum TaxID=133409 RepID=A0A8J4PP91_9MYCE|nr:hypothetical protein CYY_008069 [Polysphondylium violaceum]
MVKESKFDKNRKFETAKTVVSKTKAASTEKVGASTPATTKSTVAAAKKSTKATVQKATVTPLEVIKNIELKVIESTENANKIIEIIKICKSNSNELEIIFQGIKSLEKIFNHLLDKDNQVMCLEFSKLKRNEKPTASKDPIIVFTQWLYKIYVSYVDMLKEFLQHEDPSIQIPVLTSMMNILLKESQLLSSLPKELFNSADQQPQQQVFYHISKSMFKTIISTMLLSNHFSSKLFEHFTNQYVSMYNDLFYYSLYSVNEICMSLVEQAKSNPEQFESTHKCSVSKFAENLFDFLTFFEPIYEAPIPDWSFWVGVPLQEFIKDSSATLKKKLKSAKFVKPASITDKDVDQLNNYWNTLTKVSSYKNIFSKAWISFLTLPLPASIYKHVLLGLPERVFPHLTDPRVLMDFFSNSYDLGGVTSILALNGLFILIHKHNLEYPDFYKKLYTLFQPGVIYAKYRARFFKLADLFLSSKFLPNYVVAAFIKRSAYLCLISPPFGSLILLPLIYSLLQRHTNCHHLINLPVNINKQQQQLQQKNNIGGLLIKSEMEKTVTSHTYGNDPFIPTEEDPAKCNALKSSLWELQILRDHYAPEVSKMAKVFDSGLKNTIDMNEFSSVSYQSMYELSFKKKSADVPLAYTLKNEFISDKDFMNDWKF